MTTKLCSECRHHIGTGELTKCEHPQVVKLYKDISYAYDWVSDDLRYLASIARQYSSICGTDAKHFEPIGGADNGS